MSDYQQMEQDLLFGVLDALPYPAALMNRQGDAVYVNSRGEALTPSLYDVDLTDEPALLTCLKTQKESAARVSLPGENGAMLTGLAEFYPVKAGRESVGILCLFKPDAKKEGSRYDEIPTKSPVMQETERRMSRLARLSCPVFFLGEEGVGKEDFAFNLHLRQGHDKPFSAVEQTGDDWFASLCAALGEGRGGTVYLPDAEALTPTQIETLYPLVFKSAVRFMAGLPQNCADALLGLEILAGSCVELAPLRARPEDVPPAADYFLQRVFSMGEQPVTGFEEEARRAMTTYGWPGNLRQLEEAVIEAAITCPGGKIKAAHLPLSAASTPGPLRRLRRGFIKERIEAALAVHGNTLEGKRKAARELGIGLSTLYRLMGEEGGEQMTDNR